MALTRQQLLQNFARAEAKAQQLHPIFRGSLWEKLRVYPVRAIFTKILFKLWPRAQSGWLVKNELFTGDEFYTEGYVMDYYFCGILGEESERDLTKWFLQNVGQIEQPEVFFDVGAHHGYYGLVVAALLRDQPHSIYAFEPTPTTQVVLQKNLRAIKKAQLVKTALGEQRGQRELNVSPGKGGLNSFFAEDALRNTGSKRLTRFSVPIQTLDEFCREHDVWPTLIKLDIENAELDALRGAQRVLQQARPRVAMEVWPHPNNVRHQQAAQLLRSFGYTLYQLDDSGQTHLIHFETWFKEIYKTENIIAIP